ncbi:MAG: hypothetical protein Q9210_003083 [Variospora velana]
MAGQRVPPTVMFTPDHIRASALYWVNTCANRGGLSAGFLVSNLTDVVEYLTTRDGDMDHPMPYSTAFPTISFSTPQPEYLSPGNFDPLVANLLADGLFDVAKKMSPTSLIAARMRERAMRLLRQKEVMTPRGRRIPWWENPNYPPRALALSTPNAAAADAAAADEEY